MTSIIELYGSEEAFEEAFRQAYLDAGLPMECDMTATAQQRNTVLRCGRGL